MFDPHILDFGYELSACSKKSIIIGNGFGISFDLAFGTGCFSWRSLLDLCDIDEASPLYSLLVDCNLDFELAHQKLNNTIDVLRKYSEPAQKINSYVWQVDSLRRNLIVAVSASHPASFINIDAEADRKIENCRRFLCLFDEVYSLNYDLLLYWLRCYNEKYIGKDSFSRNGISGDLVFSPDDEASFFFPHGAIFLSKDGISAKKVKGSRLEPILASVKKNINDGIFPMCISEGTGRQKLDEINKNKYLSYCYDRLQSVSGTVFTFGCSFMAGKDEHIIQQLLRSPADRIIVGEYMPDRAKAIRLINEFEQVQARQGARRRVPVFIADTSKVNIW